MIYLSRQIYMAKQLPEMEQLFKALADATRLRILGLLLTGEVCVCHIHESLRIPQPKASRHLAYLRRAGLVDTRRDGLWVHYRMASLTDPVLGAIGGAGRHPPRHHRLRQGHAQPRREKNGGPLPPAHAVACPPRRRDAAALV